MSTSKSEIKLYSHVCKNSQQAKRMDVVLQALAEISEDLREALLSDFDRDKEVNIEGDIYDMRGTSTSQRRLMGQIAAVQMVMDLVCEKHRQVVLEEMERFRGVS